MSMSRGKSPVKSVALTSEQLLLSIEELSDEMEYFGLQPLPKFKSLDGQSGLDQNKVAFMLKSVINASFDVIQHHRMVVHNHEEADQKKQRLIDDNSSLKATIERQKSDLADKELSLAFAAEQERKLKMKCNTLQNECKTQKEEVQRLNSRLKHTIDQSVHQMRRKDLELQRLQNQLTTGSLHRVSKKTPPDTEVQPNKKMQENEDMYKKVIRKFESNNRTLVQENITLHDMMYRMNADLGLLVDEYNNLMNLYFESNKTEREVEEKETSKCMECPYGLSITECGQVTREYVESLSNILDTLKDGLASFKRDCNIFPADLKLPSKQEVEQ